MRRRTLTTLSLAVLLLVPAAPVRAEDAKTEDAKGEARKLEGNWKVLSIDAGGRLQDPGPGAQQVVILGDQLTHKMKGGEGPTYRFTVDPSQKPKAMDWLKNDGSTTGGVYELDGDDLMLCFPLPPTERKEGERLKRPGSFDAKDQPVILVTAKQQKQ